MKKSTSPQRLGLVDSDPLRLLGLQTIVSEGYQAEAVPLSGLDARSIADFDAILIDASGIDSIFEMLATIHRLKPQTRVIVIGVDEDNEFIRRVIGSGARGYLTHTATEAEVRMAVACVLDGSIWAPRKVLALLLETPNARPLTPPRLTEREFQVLNLLASGQPNRGIAARLGVEQKTVKAHVGRLMRKMGVDNRIALVMEAVRLNLVTTSFATDK
ncbi:MAG: response regulator transcription factor [Acidobacteriaceae bacterium]|nr:response regulator transcription factor [Acidobacteriaceae bacterium]